MVIDTSAFVAILLGEPSGASLTSAMEVDRVRMLAAPTMVELGLVVGARLGARGMTQLHRLVDEVEAEVVTFDGRLAELAVAGWRRFGKGNHPAALNLGDCFTYALARSTGEPILCVGDDFARTDLPVVPRR